MTSLTVNPIPLFLLFLTQSSRENFPNWKDCEGVLYLKPRQLTVKWGDSTLPRCSPVPSLPILNDDTGLYGFPSLLPLWHKVLTAFPSCFLKSI